MKAALLAFTSIALSVAAQFVLKAGVSGGGVARLSASPRDAGAWVSTFTEPMILGGLALYGLSAVVWLAVLAQWDVSRAYPLVGLGFVITAVVGYLIGEQVTALRVAGVMLICIGVVLVGKS